MGWLRQYRDAVALGAGVVLPVAVAAAIVPFRQTFAQTAAALVLVVVVVAIAANGSRLAGYVSAISASLWFDFFLTKPYERFAISHRSDIETAISLFVVGIAVSELAARNRLHHQQADVGSDFIGVIYYLSELVASGASAERIIERATAELISLLHLRRCRFATTPAEKGAAVIDHDGSVRLGEVVWGVDQMGLPGREVELEVQSRGSERGHFLMEPTPGWSVSTARCVVAVAIADQVGAALAAAREHS